MSGQPFQTQGNKFMQYGWSGISQPIQPKNIPTFMDEFEHGFPSNGLSSVSVKWWGDSDGEGEGSSILHEQSRDTKLDKNESLVESNETISNIMIDRESDINAKDTAAINEPSATFCLLRKRSAEYGHEALQVGISKGWDSYRLTKRQRLLLSQVFNVTLPSQSKDNLSNL